MELSKRVDKECAACLADIATLHERGSGMALLRPMRSLIALAFRRGVRIGAALAHTEVLEAIRDSRIASEVTPHIGSVRRPKGGTMTPAAETNRSNECTGGACRCHGGDA